MQLIRTRRRIVGWLALVAVLLAALAPAVSHALGGGTGDAWVELCTARGSQWVPADSQDPGGPPASHAFEHCPYCSLQLPALGLPPAAGPLLLGSPADQASPVARLAVPHARQPRLRALPRAPPSLS